MMAMDILLLDREQRFQQSSVGMPQLEPMTALLRLKVRAQAIGPITQRILLNSNLTVFIRGTRGDDIDAACGMLGAQKLEGARQDLLAQ